MIERVSANMRAQRIIYRGHPFSSSSNFGSDNLRLERVFGLKSCGRENHFSGPSWGRAVIYEVAGTYKCQRRLLSERYALSPL